MRMFGKIAGIIIGLALLAALAFYVVPKIDRMNAQSTQQTAAASDTDEEAAMQSFNNFLLDIESAVQYSYWAQKTVAHKDSNYVVQYGYTSRGNDYAIKVIDDDQIFRQLYVDGQYTYINDTDEIKYQNIHEIYLPDTHLLQAIAGKVIGVDGDIIDGVEVDCIQLYQNGRVYAVYFDQQGELIRFYYIYNGKEVTIDFSGFIFGDEDAYASFSISSSYKQWTNDSEDDTEDSSTDDTEDSSTDDTEDSSTDDAEDSSTDDAEDSSTDDAEDSSTDDAEDSSTDDTEDSSTDDAEDSSTETE